eukprot:TRINITY_DN2475_c0_g8_i1.p1 TRINITY_DN2475_c0_g8~~TRINITY_DN2475_c0_g8_i1.p1  ORF type:complete len:332 (+),score=77.60 TRINITY_DN2475_c0_g8_i1:103-1098(+)
MIIYQQTKENPHSIQSSSCDNNLLSISIGKELFNYHLNTNNQLKLLTSYKFSSNIREYQIYPLATFENSNTMGVFVNYPHMPIQFVDMITNRIRSSYRVRGNGGKTFDLYAINIDSSGNSLFCGGKHRTFLFDICIPGENYVWSINHKGICSSLCTINQTNGVLGTFEGNCHLFNEEGVIHTLPIKTKGIVSLKMNHKGFLYCLSRKEEKISCFDLRNLNSVYDSIYCFNSTNQRKYLDIFKDDMYAGDENGNILKYSPNSFQTTRNHLFNANISSLCVCDNHIAFTFGNRDDSFTREYQSEPTECQQRSIDYLPNIYFNYKNCGWGVKFL